MLPTYSERIGFSIWRGQALPMKAYHTHNEIEANLVVQGSFHYSFGADRYVVKKGQLALFWGSIPHRLERCQGAPKAIWFTVPLAWLMQWRLPGRLNAALLQGRLLIDREPGAYARDQAAFEGWCADFHRKPGDFWRPQLASEIQGRLRRLAHYLDTAAPEAAGGPEDPGRVAEMAGWLQERLSGKISAAGLAAHLGLNPHYTQRLFRKSFGLSLVEYLTMLRLSQAQRLLATTDQKLVDLAAACGYPSLSRFYEAFKKACGMTPRQYRLRSKP